jgi:hypothetical protein
MAKTLSKSLVIDGIAASEAIDSSGEILDVKGLDISDLESGSGVLNYEHRGDHSEGASANDIIGHITYAKKIFGPDDCDNDRELMYWNKVQLPLVYIQAELYDAEGHPGAAAAAALIRFYHKRKLPILMRYSIEGSTLKREGNVLKQAVAKRVAATIKPCNRSCVSGVLSDSDSPTPAKEKDVLASLVRTESTSPGQFRSHVEFDLDSILVNDPIDTVKDALAELREYTGLEKALSAGGYDAAPTTLSQGSALQVEDMGTDTKKKMLKNNALAALRDWRGRGDLHKFLKHRLPDASDEFIQHFAGLVNDYRLKKMRELELDLAKAVAGQKSPKAMKQSPAPVSEPKPAKVKTKPAPTKTSQLPTIEEAGEDAEAEPVISKPLTVQGIPAPLSATPVKKPYFDEEAGAVVTPAGIFHLSFPNRPHPHLLQHTGLTAKEILSHFEDEMAVNRPSHQRAMKNWMGLNSAYMNGNLPSSVISHAVAFALMSPGVKVPMQEYMYSHFIDALKNKGLESVQTPDQLKAVYADWMARNRSGLPEHARPYFEHLLSTPKGAAIRAKGGNFIGYSKPDKFRQYMDSYLRDHHKLVTDIVRENRGDGHSLAHALTSVSGIAPKLGRYTPLMFGVGDLFVPDTHNIRHMFGLRADAPGGQSGSSPDTATIDYLKHLLLNKKGPAGLRAQEMLQKINGFYGANHPAVRMVREDPALREHFAQHPNQAIGPAFWWHWGSIPGHEKRIGIEPRDAFNGETDHDPFFTAVNGLTKGEMDSDLPMRTAALHHQWVEKYGEIPAHMLYCSYIVPQLMRHEAMTKMELLKTELEQAHQSLTALPEINKEPPPGAAKFRGDHVMPGEVEVTSGPYKGNKLPFLGQDDDQIYVQSPGAASLMKLPHDLNGIGYRINSKPQSLKLPIVVDANVHADPLFTKTHEQKALIHGIDFSRKTDAHVPYSQSSGHEITGWYGSAAGKVGFVKPHIDPKWEDFYEPEMVNAQRKLSQPHREGLFHTMARDFFGMGDHVPNTAVFKHPKTGEPVSVSEKLKGAEHFDSDNEDHGYALSQAYHNGSLDKALLMDAVMGNNDRHAGNYMLTRGGPHLNLIDNGLSLDYGQTFHHNYAPLEDHLDSDPNVPSEYRRAGWGMPLHPAAVDWFRKLSHIKFMGMMLQHGVPPYLAKEGAKRFAAIQNALNQHAAVGKPAPRALVPQTISQLLGNR